MYENNSQEIENNILVLYVLNNFETSISEKALTDLMMSTGLVNYFSFQTSLQKLSKEDLVAGEADNDGVLLYKITDSGKIYLDSLIGNLSPMLRAKYDETILSEKAKILQEASVNAFSFIDINKNNSIRCYIRENGNKIVDLRIPVPDRETGEIMCENWKKNAYEVLMRIISTMNEDVTED